MPVTLDKMYAVWDGVTYELESVMPKTDSAALKKHENGKDIIFNVPKAQRLLPHTAEQRASLSISMRWQSLSTTTLIPRIS